MATSQDNSAVQQLLALLSSFPELPTAFPTNQMPDNEILHWCNFTYSKALTLLNLIEDIEEEPEEVKLANAHAISSAKDLIDRLHHLSNIYDDAYGGNFPLIK